MRDKFRQDQDNYDEGGGTAYVRSRAASRNWSLYVQEEFDVWEKLVLNAGVRYDRYSTFGGRASPRLGLVVRPSPRRSAKLLYGDAFRAPNAFELYYYGSGPEAVGPETISTYEIAFDAYLSGRIYLGGSIYREDIRDLISLDTDPGSGALFYRNLDRAEGQGIEFEIGKTWPRGTELRASVAVQRAEDETTGELLSNSPRTVAHLQLGRSWFGDRLFSGLSGHVKGRRRTVRGTEIGSSATVDLTLNVRRLARRADLAAGVYNLLDRKNADPGSEEHVQEGIPQDGRNFLVRLTYRY